MGIGCTWFAHDRNSVRLGGFGGIALVARVRCSFPGKDAGSVRILVIRGATEDAAWGRAARPGGTAGISPNPPRRGTARTRARRARTRRRTRGPQTPSTGHRPLERHARERARRSPWSAIVIETAVKTASRPSATTAYAVDSIVAIRSSPTPALPPIPCTRPTRNACTGVRTSWEWPGANSPRRQRSEEQDREHDDHHADGGLGRLLHPLREERGEEHDRQAEREERERVAERPTPARAWRTAWRPARSASQRRHRGEVVRVGRVAEAEQDRDERDQEQAAAVRDTRRCGRRGRT